MDSILQVSERVAVRWQMRQAAEAKQLAAMQAKAQEQEQFELIKAEFGVDTATVRCADKLVFAALPVPRLQYDPNIATV